MQHTIESSSTPSAEVAENKLKPTVLNLERIRTQEIISRYLKEDPLTIIDIGGGSGENAFWLNSLGHQVHFLDSLTANVEKAVKNSFYNHQDLVSIQEGSPLQLPFADNIFDLAIMLGSLSNYREKEDRTTALSEVKRILKPGGYLLCSVYCRKASPLNPYSRPPTDQGEPSSIKKPPPTAPTPKNSLDDIKNTVIKNPVPNYLYRPEELKLEILSLEFKFLKILPIENFGWMLPDIETVWKNEAHRQLLQDIIHKLEDEPSIIGTSTHIMGIAQKKL